MQHDNINQFSPIPHRRLHISITASIEKIHRTKNSSIKSNETIKIVWRKESKSSHQFPASLFHLCTLSSIHPSLPSTCPSNGLFINPSNQENILKSHLEGLEPEWDQLECVAVEASVCSLVASNIDEHRHDSFPTGLNSNLRLEMS